MTLRKGNPMQRSRFTAPVLILLILCQGAVRAEDITVPAKLPLADAIALALRANANLKQAAEGHRTALSRSRIASFDTSLSVGSDVSLDDAPGNSGISSRAYSTLNYESVSGTEASLELSPFGWGSYRGSVGLSLQQPLMKGRGPLSEKSYRVQEALTDVAIQDKQLYRSRQSTVRGVIAAYYRAVQAREQVKIQERALSLVEAAAEYARRREEAGLARGIDVSRAQVQVAQTRDRLNVQRESARARVDALMLAIGAGVGQNPELTDAVPDASPSMPGLEEAIETALANRSELAVYDERLSSQNRRLAIAEDELRPEVNALASFRSTDAGAGFVSGSMFDLGSTTVGVALTFPLDRRISEEERDIAARSVDLLQEQRAFQTEEIAEEARGAHRSLEAAGTSLDIFSQNLDVAKQNLHIAERMVEEGEGDNRDVLTAQEALTGVESGIISAKTDLYLAGVDLRYAMGEDLTTMGSK